MKKNKKGAIAPDAKQKTLDSFFQRQSQNTALVKKIKCPACNLEIPESKINWHLDQNCKSRSGIKKAKDENLSKRKKILKAVKDDIAKKERQKAMLSDDEMDNSYDSDDIVVLDGDHREGSDEPFITSSMVETKLFELDGEVYINSSPGKLNDNVPSPYFSSNSKQGPLPRPVQKHSEKIIDVQIPNTSKNSCIAQLELDWSSPNSTPIKNDGKSPSNLSTPTELSNKTLYMLEKDWNSCSPLKTPTTVLVIKTQPNRFMNSDSESDDFDEKCIEFRTPKKFSKRSLKKSPNSQRKIKDVNENLHSKQTFSAQKILSDNVQEEKLASPGPKISASVSNRLYDNNEDFEHDQFQNKTLEKSLDEKVKYANKSCSKDATEQDFYRKITTEFLSSPVSNTSNSGGEAEDSESFFTPLRSPALVSPVRSPTPSLDSTGKTSDDHLVDASNKSNDGTHVRNLFPLPDSQEESPSPKVTLSQEIKNNSNRFSKTELGNIGKGEISEVSPSQAQKSPSNSPGKQQRIWVRTPRKINQSLKSSALLQNSPQKASVRFMKKSSSSPSPEKSLIGSQNSVEPPEENPLDNSNDKSKYRIYKGYLLENFLLILKTVMSEPSDLNLFDNEDLSIINGFHDLSLQAQKLYVRLFQRKIKWNKVSKIHYQDICDLEDTGLYVKELSYANFLFMENKLSDLEEVLQMLSAEELQRLCKGMKISASGTKENMTKTLLKFSKQQRTLTFFTKGASENSVMLKRAKEMMGECCIVNKDVRRVFMRVLMLYGLPSYDEEDDKGQSTQLTTLLLVNLGRMNFPSYKITRQHSLFQSREELIRFEGCSQILADVQECVENQRWEEALNHCKLAKATYDELRNDKQLMKHESELPRFLRRFTSISLLIYVLTCSVECYQRLKNYRKAVEQLEFLLAQKTHLQDYRGRWYDRLALNLDTHLKSPKVLAVIREALHDPEVRKGHRLSLSIRARRMAASSRWKSHAEELLVLPLMNPRESPKVIIEGRCLPGDAGYKKVFIRQDSDRHAGEGEVTVCSVEELVLGYYNSKGYTDGLHREGTTVNSLFGLFFWDILYSPVPDVFRSPHQSAPLDLDDPHFYKARKELIDQRLSELANWSENEAELEIERVWKEHAGKASLIAWDLFRSLDYLKGLVASMTLPVLASICKRLAEDHRFTRSGFPDLIVWDPVNKKCRIVEVKGPNDRLSTKQILWLDYLLEHGAEAEVCHVEAAGAKKMKLASPRRVSPKKRSPVKKIKKKLEEDEATIFNQETESKKVVKRQKRKDPDNTEEHLDKKKRRTSKRDTEVKKVVKGKIKKKTTEDDDFIAPPPKKSKRKSNL